MLEPFIPSLIIVLSVSAAFAGGRVLGLVVRRFPTFSKGASLAVGAVALAFGILLATNGSSRYALLLPAALALGFFRKRRDPAPSVFR